MPAAAPRGEATSLVVEGPPGGVAGGRHLRNGPGSANSSRRPGTASYRTALDLRDKRPQLRHQWSSAAPTGITPVTSGERISSFIGAALPSLECGLSDAPLSSHEPEAPVRGGCSSRHMRRECGRSAVIEISIAPMPVRLDGVAALDPADHVARGWRREPPLRRASAHGGRLTHPNDSARRLVGWLTSQSPTETIADALH